MAMFFLYQKVGGEEKWKLELAEKRDEVIRDLRPAFTTVLDLSSIPDDNDWSKVRYRGPYYADFDADGDLDLACKSFQTFVLKLEHEYGFDPTQARYYASGGKGFHMEIPQECFIPKPPPTGTVWLPQIYEHMSRELVVETLDMRVYTGRRGRMWRTANVQRESGTYKVSLSLDEVYAIEPGLYRELVSEPRDAIEPNPPSCNSQLAMLFMRAQTKVSTHMRGAKKRREKSSAVLAPWKKSGKTPSAIEALMDGTGVAEGAGFQSLSMQLAIYATSVGMALAEFINRCAGLCENHVSDSRRYNSPGKRREELERMYRYMEDSALYDFDIGPIVSLVRPGVSVADLGVIEKEDVGDVPTEKPKVEGDEKPKDEAGEETPANNSLRAGFFVNGDGMWKTTGDKTNMVCRAVVRNVEAFYDGESPKDFKGYEFDIYLSGKKQARSMLGAEGLVTAGPLKKFFAAHQIAFQGGDTETVALLDVMAEKARSTPKIYMYPREGLTVINHPTLAVGGTLKPVRIYLAKDHFVSSEIEGTADYFRMKYRPAHAMSAYNIDIHDAPELDDSMIPALHDLFLFNKPEVVADLVGWFIGCHYHAIYLHLFAQFPLLQVYGEAGAGKSQSILMLSRLHWFATQLDMKSASSFTPFTLDVHASTSSSAPLIIDEYKPRELRKKHGAYEKLKDVFKQTYIGAGIGERGTLNKGAETTLAVVKSRAAAPIVFLGESVEMESAIVERCVSINLTKANHVQYPERTEAFVRLQDNTVALSALGKWMLALAFDIDDNELKASIREIQASIEAGLPSANDPTARRVPARMVFNRAVIIRSLRDLKAALALKFGDEFDASCDMLLGARSVSMAGEDDKLLQVHAMSEMSKVLSRAAILSRARDQPWELLGDKDYVVGDGWIELRVDRVYDQYRRYCASINDAPLFDNLDSFLHAMGAYNACIDQICVASELRAQDETGRIVRLDLKKLTKEGVQSFKS